MKKTRFLMLSIILILCFICIDVKAETEFIYGDVDNNGVVDTRDATAIGQYLTNLIELDYDAQKRADVDGDNKVSLNDKVLINAAEAEIIDTLPVKMGDINQDGVINQADVDLLSTFVDGSVTPTAEQKLLANVYYDELIDNNDLTTLRGYLNGTINVLPAVDGKVIDVQEVSESNDTETPSAAIKKDKDDKEQVVKVDDTAAKIPLIISIISISLVITGGVIVSIVLLKKNKK